MWRVGDEPVPGYRLESLLGKGSNAEVWQATGPGRTATALKFIDLGGKLGLKEFRGIQRVKEIRHAHLLPITAFWVLDNRGSVMDDRSLESLDDKAHGRDVNIGGTLHVESRRPETLVVAMLVGDANLSEQLHRYRKKGHTGIPVEKLLDYMEDAAKGLDFLNSRRHDLGSGPVAIQHCDVKPQNIVLVGDSAMVCDFGLARVLGGGDTHATLTGPAGTPAYIAPECIRAAQPSHATDQYSLAITYFELRTGKLPFEGYSLMDIYESHTSGSLQLGPLPQAEQQVIFRATSLEPKDRYPSVLEMVRALRRAVEQQHAARTPEQALPPAAEPERPAAEPPRAATTRSDVGRKTEADPHPAAGPRRHSLGREDKHDLPSCGSVAGEADTYAIHFEPRHVEVTIDGRRRKLDEQGRIEVRGRPDTCLEICAVAAGFEEFREALTIVELASLSYRIALWPDARYLVEQGMAALKREDVEAAIKCFDEAIEIAPDFAEAYYGRAMAHGATVEYRRGYAGAFNEQAHSHFAEGHYDRAIADFTEAIRINPDLAEAHRCRILRNRAVAYRNRGDYQKAIADYDEVIRLHPDFAAARHDRALTFQAMGDYDKAIDDYTEALRLIGPQDNPEYRRNLASTYRRRGDVHYQNGNYDRALHDYAEAVRVRPDWGILYNQRGRVQGARGEYGKAVADYTRAIQFDDEFAYLYFYNRGSAYYKKGDFNKAIADFSAALDRKPDYAKAYRYRSRAHAKIGMEGRAKADWDKAKELG